MAQKMQKAIMAELVSAHNINIEELLKELDPATLQAKMEQAKERAEALRFLCMYLIKYLKENNFYADFIKFFNEILEKTDSFLGGEPMFMDLSEEKLNDLCDVLANELLCFNNKGLLKKAKKQ